MTQINRKEMGNCFLLHIYIVIYLSFTEAVQSPALPPFESLDANYKGVLVPPCEACRSLVASFLQALEETSRSNFEGGDADWEKQKLGTYENSELRLIEINEQVCSEMKRGKDQCYNLAEVHEELLEEWFLDKRHKNVDLLQFLCIEHLKICCPDNTYGRNCVPCPGGVKSPCRGRGRCKNGGTREEPGTCICDAGYKGELCDDCEKGYYIELTPKFVCNICDISCKDHCRGPGPKHCEVCASGYTFVPNEGCIRVKEEEEDDDDYDTEDPENSSEEISVSPGVDENDSTVHKSTEDVLNHETLKHSEF